MDKTSLIAALDAGTASFNDVIGYIDSHFDFEPTAFRNGDTYNEANTNNGSCKIFAFAQQLGLSQQATLHAFGDYYRVDVLEHPKASDHANIRNFMRSGWAGIHFEGQALRAK